MHRYVLYALAAAALFGASTPIAKLLAGDMSPVLLAGLLYAGSGVGLNTLRCLRDGGVRLPALPRSEWFWLSGAIVFGGVLGPLALMFGLRTTGAAAASLLLNLEAVLTASMAWLIFREHTDRRMVLGMAAIVAGGVVLGWSPDTGLVAPTAGPALVGLACLCWAIDNNLTRKVSASDALFIAGTKGGVAGIVNVALACSLHAQWPSVGTVAIALLVGFCGYGISLVLFVLALRGLGAARTGAYFSTAPFLGASLALAFFSEPTPLTFWMAAGLMALGVWLHLSERHAHSHHHEVLSHDHTHTHDEHHQHAHVDGAGEAVGEAVGEDKAHSHWHVHAPIQHSHAHYPDIHHRHQH